MCVRDSPKDTEGHSEPTFLPPATFTSTKRFSVNLKPEVRWSLISSVSCSRVQGTERAIYMRIRVCMAIGGHAHDNSIETCMVHVVGINTCS